MLTKSIYTSFLDRNSGIPSAICTCNDWNLVYANENLVAILPQRATEAIGNSFLHYLRDNGFNELEDLCSNSQEGDILAIHDEGKLYVVRWRIVHDPALLDEPMRLVHVNKVPLDPIRRMANLPWQELNVLIDSIYDGIWVIDGDGITLRVNKAMERIAGVTAADVVGKHVSEPMKNGLFSDCVTLRALTERRVVSMFDDYSNGKRCLNTSTPILDDQGNIWRVIASIRDITELENLQNKLITLEKESQAYKTRLMTMEKQSDAGFVGHSQATRDLRTAIYRAGRTEATTLVLGETGTGKTLAAKAIHGCGARAQGPFISVNCGAIPESLIESELFGYDSGAFTGAVKGGKQGMFELANGGTLLLDEVGELPLAMQVKLLQVLDEHAFYRVGGTKRINVNVHILAATNKDLADMVNAKTFREDLYYRLRVITMHIPPLRERAGDIPSLAMHFLENYNTRYGARKRFSSSIISYFLSYSWPGNVRELRAIVEALASMGETNVITEAELPTYIRAAGADAVHSISKHQTLKEAVEALEREMVATALQEGGSTYKAAKMLGISQSSVVRKAQRHRIGIVEIPH